MEGKMFTFLLAIAVFSSCQCASVSIVCKTRADIAFILDASGSVGSTNYKKALQSLQKLVDTFSIDKDQVRVGVIVYSTTSSIKFSLDKYTTKDSLKNAISKLPYTSGYTNTPAALLDTIKLLTSASYGGRQDPVPNIAIIFTDGNTNKGVLSTAVSQLRKSPIEVFAVGIGHSIKTSELNLIASSPASSHVFRVSDYNQLQSKVVTIGHTLCPTAPPTPPPTPPPTLAPTLTPCKTRADVAFILDASGSVGGTNYKKALQFLQNLVDTFSIGKDQVLVGVIVYSTKSSIKINLNKFTTKASLKNAISKLPYTSGYTNTPAALLDTIKLLTSASYGGRKDPVPNIAIIFTDGNTNKGVLSTAVSQLRKSAIEVFAVGIGHSIKTSELKLIASSPASSHVFRVSDYNQLQSKVVTLGHTLCPTSPPTPPPTSPPPPSPTLPPASPPCHKKVDIALILDASGSVGKANYNRALRFLQKLVGQISVSANEVRVGVIVYSKYSKIHIRLNKYTTAATLKKAIAKLPYRRRATNTPAALWDAIKLLTSKKYGGRADPVPNVGIIFTDGKSNRGNLKRAIIKLRKTKIKMFAVGIGKSVSIKELRRIAGSSSNIILVKDYSKLKDHIGKIGKSLCPNKYVEDIDNLYLEDTGNLDDLEDTDNLDDADKFNTYGEDSIPDHAEEMEMMEENEDDPSQFFLQNEQE